MKLNPENFPENGKEKELKDEKLTEKEALAYQTYATEKSNVGFSEKADESAYEEAGALLQELELKGIKLDGIDFKKINLKDVVALDDANERLKEAILVFEKAKNKGTIEKITKALNTGGLKGFIVLLNMFAILSGGIAHAAVDDWKKAVPKMNRANSEQFRKESRGDQEYVRVKNIRMGSTMVSFMYNAKGDPVQFIKETNRDAQFNEKLGIAVEHMLNEDIDNVLKNAPLPGYPKGVGINIVKRNLENICGHLIENIGVYKQLLKMGNNKEAQYLLNTMSNSIAKQERLIGAEGEVFNAEFINSVLNVNE